MVLAITDLLRAQQPVLGRDVLQLQCAVVESSSTLGSDAEYYKTGALQQWTFKVGASALGLAA